MNRRFNSGDFVTSRAIANKCNKIPGITQLFIYKNSTSPHIILENPAVIENKDLCPFCGDTPSKKNSRSDRMKRINANSGVAGGIAGLDDNGVSLDGLNEWYNCRRCSRKYVWVSKVEADRILANIDGSPDIPAIVHHYYPAGVTLTELIQHHRTGIVRRYSGRLSYILEPLALRAVYICFNHNGERTYAVLVRKESSDTLYTVVTMEVPLA